jgi:hypothetical protein
MYFSKAIVIEGAFGDGKISILKPLSKASFVWYFQNGYSVSFFLKSGKFLNNDLIPVGLKKGQYIIIHVR